MLQLADKIICVSEKFCEYMKKERPDLEGKIDFLNNGIENIKINRRLKKVNEEERFTIISAGGGMKIKNNLSVCKAIEKISNKKIKFIVIGKLDKDGNEIKSYDFVEYYENLSHEEVLQKMKESDLYIQNSLFETFGLGVCEAISCGCKILISKNVGAISIIENLKESMVINKVNDTEEIKRKIVLAINSENNKEICISNKKNSWESRAIELIEKIK